MPDIVNFALLVAGCFNISTKTLELYFGKQLNYVKTVRFLYLAFKMTAWDQSAYQWRANRFSLWRQDCECSTQTLRSWRLYRLEGRNRRCSQPEQGPAAVPLTPSQDESFPSSASFLTHSCALLSALLKAPGASRVFPTCSLLSGILRFILWTPSVSQLSALSPQLELSASLCLPAPCTIAWTLPPGSEVRQL